MMNYCKNQLKKFQRGETLLEVIIALVVIMIGSATAANLIVTSLKANIFNKDSLLALNLAQEGIEYMHNLRDTNWLRFSANTQECWDMQPNQATCDGKNNRLKIGNYSLGDNLSNLQTLPLDLSNGIDKTVDGLYALNYYDLDTATDSDNDGKSDNDKNYLASDYTASPTVKMVGNTKFFRMITISYQRLDSSTGQFQADSDEIKGDMMLISTTVQWLDGATIHQIKLNSALTKYK